METESKLRLADVFVSITDPRQANKIEHELVELLVVAVNAVLVGADTFVEIERRAQERIDWLRRYLRLEHGIPSHDIFGCLFGLINPDEFEAAFRRWTRAVLPTLGKSNENAAIPELLATLALEGWMPWGTGHAAHNLAILKHITLNLIRLDPIKRKGGIKARRFIAATSDAYRELLLGLG